MAQIQTPVERRDAGPRIARVRRARVTREDLEMIERTRAARDLFSSKWKVDLLYLLARGVRRYSRLYDNLKGASKKMLTDSLRGLERDGLVERRLYAEVPVRVEYSLTPLGWSATKLLLALADWAKEHLTDVEDARRRYQQARAETNEIASARLRDLEGSIVIDGDRAPVLLTRELPLDGER
jgi:DNA-binding HxlR family transcriptional regulator